jgi:hypothetical protein
MLKALKQQIWRVAFIFAGFSQHGALGPDAAVFVVAALLEAAVTILANLGRQGSTSRTNPPNSQGQCHAYP